MIGVSTSVANADLAKDLHDFEDNLGEAGKRICNRLGLAAEVIASDIAAVNTGRMRDETRWTGARRTPDGWEGDLVAHAAHSIYVEMGYQEHFVPFSTAPSLYRQALQRWGWRPAKPDEIPSTAKPGDKWLVPKGRKRAVKGVKVSGKAQPFLRPALREVNDTIRDKVVREEIQAAIRRSRGH